jgi:GNAT superfamily N-acetyltransferase
MSIEIRPIVESDLPVLFELMVEFVEYEKLSDQLEIRPQNYVKVMFGENAFVEGLLAFSDGEPIGFALFYRCFATFRSVPGMFLEDLFVSERGRGNGIGDLLLRAVAKRAKERGLERIDMWVLDWNSPAIEFYKKRGAHCETSDRHFKFVDTAFARLAE